MAIGTTGVGGVDVFVNAVTTGVRRQIADGFRGLDSVGAVAGKKLSNSFNREIEKLRADKPLGRVQKALEDIAPGARGTYAAFVGLVRIGYVLQAGLGQLSGTIGAVVGGIGALGGAAVFAAPSIAALGGAFGSLIVGMQVAKGAFKGIGQALSGLKSGGGGGGADTAKATEDAMRSLALVIEANQRKIVNANNKVRDAQLGLNNAFKEGREEIQQLGFAAEQAALGEQKAALELEKARETLARTQDLPPNSRVRREAELAYQEAELNYRQAKDSAGDLAKEQDRLSQQGVEGTQVVIDARRELANAELELRDTVLQSLRDQEEAQRRLNDAQSGAGGGGGRDPLANLTESQKKFVNYLYTSVLPALFSLKEASADSFLPVLQQQMERLFAGGVFERLRSGIESVSKGLAVAVTNFTDVFMQQDNLDNFTSFFETSAALLPRMGSIFGNVFSSILTILDAAAPLTERFVGSIDRATQKFANFLNLKNSTGELTVFFSAAGQIASRFGDILGNLLGAIGKIAMANFGPGSGGDIILSWLEKATQNLANLNSTFLQNYFTNAANNLTEVLDTFGILVQAIMKAGADPALGEFFQILQSGAAEFFRIADAASAAGPALGKVVNSLFQMFAVFADVGPLVAFLDTLAFLAAGASSLVQAMRPLLAVIGPIFAAASALSIAFSTLGKVKSVLVGFVLKGVDAFKVLSVFLIKQTEQARTLAIAETNLAAAKTRLNLLEKEAAVTAAARAVQRANETKDATLIAIATQREVVAKEALSVANTQAGITAMTAGTMMKAAFGPVGLVLIALTAAATLAFAVIAQRQQAFDDAVTKSTESLKNGVSAVKLYTKAAAEYEAINLDIVKSTDDVSSKAQIFASDIDNLSYGISLLGQDVGKVVDTQMLNLEKTLGRSVEEGMDFNDIMLATASNGGIVGDEVQSTREKLVEFNSTVKEVTDASLRVMSKSLANIATTDLPQAQKGFRDLTGRLTDSSKITYLMSDAGKELRDTLIDQATAYGQVIETADGTINTTKLLEAATGTGVYAAQASADALLAQKKALADLSSQYADSLEIVKVGDVIGETDVKQTFESGLKDLADIGLKANQEYQASIALMDKGFTEASIKAIQDKLGLSSQQILENVTANGDALLQETLVAANQAALALSGLYAPAIAAINEGGLTEVEKLAQAALDAGTITIDQFLGVTETKLAGYDPVVEVFPDTAEWDALPAELKAAAEAAKPDPINLEYDATMSVKSGGITLGAEGGMFPPLFIPIQVTGFKNGGLVDAIRMAAGGMVSGPGGGRDDLIPAVLSAGEYVMNAAATRRYLPLLNELNNGSPVMANRGAPAGGSNINITVNPSPGMNERELASAVSRELAFQMRKGSV